MEQGEILRIAQLSRGSPIARVAGADAHRVQRPHRHANGIVALGFHRRDTIVVCLVLV